MGKGPGLYIDIGKKARDLLYKDYQCEKKLTITTHSTTGPVISSSATKTEEQLLADVGTQLNQGNTAVDAKVDTDSNLLGTITDDEAADEAAPNMKAILSFTNPEERSAKLELQCLHDYAGITTSVGLTANPTVNVSYLFGTSVASVGTDISLDTKTGNFTKYDAGLSFTNADLSASLALNEKGNLLNASYYHLLSPLTNSAVGAEVNHNFSTNKNTITIGTQHALDPLTTVKVRVNNSGKVHALIQHEWRPKSLFTISGEVDTKAVDKTAKLGLGLAVKV